MRREEGDLVVTAETSQLLSLWIPSDSAHDVAVEPKVPAEPTPFNMEAPSTPKFFDETNHRLCIQVRLMPGSRLRVAGYFSKNVVGPPSAKE